MNRDLSVSKSIDINASAQNVWRVLTEPDKIKVYLFGTNTITDWNVGSPITFQGEYEGHTYTDKGNVLENTPHTLLKYNYWSGFSGLEDKPENYSIITYTIEEGSQGQVHFTWTQEGFATEQGYQHTENGLPAMLEQIKQLAENIDA